MRAAEYVRVSTDLQQYSIVNQQAAIAEYAARHNYEIVKTYSDSAKSGLDIKGRPGLQQLIDDVLGGGVDFHAVIVFDVSRWGRFQDSDEAACYEFLCKRAGIFVHYCAEPFSNDGTPFDSFLKTIKRTMAAEYARELSAKVFAGQSRLAAKGYKLGGRAGFGLRRLLLDSEGRPKIILQEGQEKHLATDRVMFTLGPPEEVAIVRDVFSMFLEQDMALFEIARVLNDRGVKTANSGLWDTQVVSRMLKHPKYTGSAVFNRRSQKLRSKMVQNPKEQWILRANTFPAIISQEDFDRAQAKLANRVPCRSNQQLLEEMKAYIEKHGKPLPRSGLEPGMATPETYARRFGGMVALYETLGFKSVFWTAKSFEHFQETASLTSEAFAEMRRVLAHSRIRVVGRKSIFRVQGRGYFRLAVGRRFTTASGDLRWNVMTRPNCPKHTLIVIRLQPENEVPKDFVVFSNAPKGKRRFTLSNEMVHESGIVYPTASEAANAIVSTPSRRVSASKSATDALPKSGRLSKPQ
jgi:DNA invertase Pin-like site-specific DNA recombinase